MVRFLFLILLLLPLTVSAQTVKKQLFVPTPTKTATPVKPVPTPSPKPAVPVTTKERIWPPRYFSCVHGYPNICLQWDTTNKYWNPVVNGHVLKFYHFNTWVEAKAEGNRLADAADTACKKAAKC